MSEVMRMADSVARDPTTPFRVRVELRLRIWLDRLLSRLDA